MNNIIYYLQNNASFEVLIVELSLCAYIIGLILFSKQRLASGFSPESLYKMGGYYYASPSLFRLVSSIFIHRNISHLYYNMFSLFVYGYIISSISSISSLERFIIFMLSSVLATILSSIRMNKNIVSVGASGGVMGLIGAVLCILMFDVRHDDISKTFFTVILLTTLNDLNSQIIHNIRGKVKINVAVHIYGILVGFIITSIIIYTRTYPA